MDQTTINLTAQHVAKVAHERWFRDRSGTVDNVLYDNNPIAADPTLRDRVYAAVLEDLAEVEGVTPERASYPTSGEDEGYTLALAFPDDDERGAEYASWVERQVSRRLGRALFGTKPNVREVEEAALRHYRRSCVYPRIYDVPSSGGTSIDLTAETVEISNGRGTLAKYQFSLGQDGAINFVDAD